MPLRVKEKLLNTTVKALSRSMDLKVLTHLVRTYEPTYDLHKRMNIPSNNAIPNRDGAKQVVKDIRDWDYFPSFILQLIDASERGFHGKKYSIPFINDILRQLSEEGLDYDSTTRQFRENPRVCRSHNWGILRTGEVYPFTFVKLDFVQNSSAVRNNPPDLVQKCYQILREEIAEILEYHHGRLWLWEGDGGLISFHYDGRSQSAVITAMEIQHRLFLFNHFRNPLKDPIQLRIALICRQSEYWAGKTQIRQSEAFQAIETLESEWTQPGGITISGEVHSHLDKYLANEFTMLKRDGKGSIYSYQLQWENL